MNATIEAKPARRALPPLMSLSDGAAERLKGLYAPSAGDESVTDKGVTVLVDRNATLFLIGTVMDYEVKAMSAGFTFTNPNEKGRCGCGESFHV
jgi:iron-sulfur cluster assembly protein